MTYTADPRVDAYIDALPACRQISIYRGEAINRTALLPMFREIIAPNRAGGWRKIKRATK